MVAVGMPAAAAVARTLAYGAIFRFPLTFNEIVNRLIAEQPISATAVQEALAWGRRRGCWRLRADYYFLPEISYRRRRRGWFWSRQKLSLAQKLAKVWQPLDGIRLLAVTGSVAAMNAYPLDDVDVLTVTSGGKLWQTRLRAELRLRRLKIPRRPAGLKMQRSKLVENKICPNVWLAVDSLRLPPEKRNLFVAEEIMQMKIIFDKDNLYRRFLAANADWLGRYLANWLTLTNAQFQKSAPAAPLSWPERLAFWGQKLYMARRRRRESVSPGSAFFHPHDRSEYFLSRHRHILRRLPLPRQIYDLALSIAS